MAITTHQVMTPYKVALSLRFWAVYLALTAFFCFNIPSPGFIAFNVLVIFPIILMFGNRQNHIRLAKKCMKEAGPALEQFIGSKPQYIDSSWSGVAGCKSVSGTGIAYADKTFYLMDHGLCAKFTLEDIRSWRWNIEGVAGVNSIVSTDAMVAVSGAAIANLQRGQAKFDALIESGFFITVSNIDKPVWQFMTDEGRILNRWMEILNQVEEGKI